MSVQVGELFPALRTRATVSVDQHAELARRVLWRAFQEGRLSDEEFASTLERLEPSLEAEDGP